jgi:hypothetical protein
MTPGVGPQSALNGTPADLALRLQEQLTRQVRGFQVQVEPPGIILRGRVTTYYAKQVAQHLIMRMTDLPILTNDIEVG